MITPSTEMDTRQDNLCLHERASRAEGCTLRPSRTTLAADALVIDVLPGVLVIDDHPVVYAGVEALDCNEGLTLSALSEQWTAVVAYWNEATSEAHVIAVPGAEALSTAGASQPDDDAIAAELPDASYPFVVLGAVKFKQTASALYVDEIDHLSRSFGVFSSSKIAAASATSPHRADGDGAVYRLHSKVRITRDAADIADGDLLTNYPLDFYGKVGGGRVICEKAITTAAKNTSLNAEIDTTNVTGWGGAYAGAKATGAVTALSPATAAHTFRPGQTLSIEAASTTAFVEGQVTIEVDLYELVQPAA